MQKSPCQISKTKSALQWMFFGISNFAVIEKNGLCTAAATGYNSKKFKTILYCIGEVITYYGFDLSRKNV